MTVRRGPVGVVGLGLMGSAMSTHLLAAGHPVLGHDIDARRRDEHAARGGTVCGSAAAVARGPTSSSPRCRAPSALFDGAGRRRTACAPARGAGLVVVETSTLGPDAKRAAHDRAQAWGATVLDCPMSGTAQQARDGDLVAYLSGDAAAKRVALPVLAACTRAQHDLGEFGRGTTMKLVANLLVAVHNAAAAEALLLAQRAGLDLDQVLAAVGDGAGGSRMLAVRGPLMAAGSYAEPTATVATMQKDNALIAAFAAGVASPTPLFSATAVLYQAAVAQGRMQEDTACVFGVLQRLAGH